MAFHPVSKFLEEADLRHAGDSFWLFYGSVFERA